MKNKFDVFETFKKWKAMVEIETSLKVKCLRSDNGGEYIGGWFSEYCVAQEIKMEKTIPGTPQQNGVAERMNKTLNERARSMRLHAGLPKTFWVDAVSTAAYLINRGPSVPMEFRRVLFRSELVHTNLWGPFPVSSLGGTRYYITFIDDLSRKV